MGEAMKRDAGAVAAGERTGLAEPLDLLGMEEEALVSLCEEMGEAAYRGRQLFSWLYARGARDFSRMTNLPGSLREKLSAAARVGALELDRRSRSADGTEKYAWRLRDGARVESVRVPMRTPPARGGGRSASPPRRAARWAARSASRRGWAS